MAQESITKCFGLVTQYNALSLQPGSLIIANNVRVSRDNIIENRRGYKEYGALSAPPAQFMKYRGRILAHDGALVEYDDGAGTFAAYTGTYNAPPGAKMHFQESKNNIYTTTSAGVKVFQDLAGSVAREAGAPRGINISTTPNSASGGFLSNNDYTAYRYVIQRTDANGNLLIGFPSERRSVQNTSGGNKNIDVRCFIATDVSVGDELLLYRTGTSSTIEGVGDDMKLIYSINITSTDVTNKYVDVVDVVIEAIRSQSENLYTNVTQEGIQQGNSKPPLAEDIALYKNFMFYVNTKTEQQLFSTLVSIAGLDTKTFTLAGLTYTFTTGAENIGTRNINISATSVTAVDIERTALSLVNVVNGQASGLVYAYYVSSDVDLPGQMLFVARSITTAAFSIASAAIVSEFSPQLESAAYSKTTSSNDEFKNGYYYSKAQQFEHVPLANNGFVGPAQTKILRAVALRDSLIFIKEEGVYRLTGEDPSSFTVAALDLTVRCKCPESVAVLSNQIFMLSNQGVVRITDTGVEIISQAIEPNIVPILSLPNVGSLAYGVGYESDHTYWLSVPTNANDTSNTQTYVYDILSKAWVRDPYGITCGIVEDNTDRIYIAKPGLDEVFQERKDQLFDDYTDPEYAINITALNGREVTLTVAGSQIPKVGDVIRQGGTNNLIVHVQGPAPYVVTMKNPIPGIWQVDPAEIFPGIEAEVRWAPWTAQNPDLLKQVRQVDFLIDNIPGNSFASSIVATFVTDFQEESEVTIESQASGWGTSPWGQFPWGGIKDSYLFATYVPMNNQYCRTMNPGLRFLNALERIAIAGVGFTFNPISERVGR